MSRKRTQRQVIRLALIRAMGDRQSFAGCWERGAPEARTALEEVSDYRALLNLKYGGEPPDPHENAKAIPLHEIAAQIKGGPDVS